MKVEMMLILVKLYNIKTLQLIRKYELEILAKE